MPEYVSILADNTPITSLSKTTITLWNRGTKALTRDLVARSITVDVDEAYLIFSSSVINTTDSSIGAHVVDTKDPNRKTLEFNHLDKADGFQVELFHDSRVIPRVSGRILGHKKRGIIDIDKTLNSKILSWQFIPGWLFGFSVSFIALRVGSSDSLPLYLIAAVVTLMLLSVTLSLIHI